MTNVQELRYEIDHANLYGRGVTVPAGVFALDYPIRYPISGAFRGECRATRTPEGDWLAGTMFVPKTTTTGYPVPYYTPLLLPIPPGADTSPIDADGLHPDGSGWFSFSDYFHPNPVTEFCFEIDLTLNTLPDDERFIACARGTVGITPGDGPLDIPFRLSVYGGQLKLRSGVSSWESGSDCVAAGVRTRLVAQHGPDQVLLWRIVDGVRTLLYQVTTWPLEWPAECLLTVGVSPARFPEGQATDFRPVDATIRACSAVAICPYSESGAPGPPAPRQDVRDNYLGVWTRFAEPDGCLFRGTVTGKPAVFLWRSTTADIPGRQLDTGDFTLDGLNRCPAGLWTMGAKESCISRIDIGGCHYGLMLFAQGYNGLIEQVHAGSNSGVGIALCNNSAIQKLSACHTGEGNGYGIAAVSAAGLKIDGGWGGNNALCNLLVTGDRSSVVVSAGGFGFEGAGRTGRANVVLDHVESAVFAGTDLYMAGNTFPAVEMRNCAGGHFDNIRFSLPKGSVGGIRTADHDPTRPLVVTEGKRFGGSESVPARCPGNT